MNVTDKMINEVILRNQIAGCSGSIVPNRYLCRDSAEVIRSLATRVQAAESVEDYYLTLLTQAEDEVQDIRRMSGQVIPVSLKPSQLADVCMSKRHDFGLLPTAEQEKMIREAAEWWRCFERNLNNPPAWITQEDN